MARAAMQVPLGEGYSQMDWIRYKKSEPDLAGKPTSGVSPGPFSAAQLPLHLLPSSGLCVHSLCRAKWAAQTTQHHVGGGEAAQHRGRCVGSLEWQGDLLMCGMLLVGTLQQKWRSAA